MEKLYFNDTYLFETNSQITRNSEDEFGKYLILSKTIFHPQGGGQPSDNGIIQTNDNNIRVLHVKQVAGEIRHYHESESVTENEMCYIKIDEARRMLNAKYHSAAHLLGNIVESISIAQVRKGHAYPGEAYIEAYGNIALNETALENMVSEVIQNDLAIIIDNNDLCRTVQIGDYPKIPCGGTHVVSTKEIGIIKIKKITHKKNITRISFEVL
ncbi:MAG: hypothetical protein J0G32_07685 [Alphaproteobacteria bacterium]|nr:hypothetical protein [Alphaproteobacteria bacterium]OJV13752.1 MAG: hypothetical protein BGO27_01475 [Alphaproteobacteria bacterium 33-17]